MGRELRTLSILRMQGLETAGGKVKKLGILSILSNQAVWCGVVGQQP